MFPTSTQDVSASNARAAASGMAIWRLQEVRTPRLSVRTFPPPRLSVRTFFPPARMPISPGANLLTLNLQLREASLILLMLITLWADGEDLLLSLNHRG